ncbi:MAG: hypothetical protein FJ037_06265 [Chloroflexi bacterium]|nr:hypothetical protein [Chloroflexota bacterium]
MRGTTGRRCPRGRGGAWPRLPAGVGRPGEGGRGGWHGGGGRPWRVLAGTPRGDPVTAGHPPDDSARPCGWCAGQGACRAQIVRSPT